MRQNPSNRRGAGAKTGARPLPARQREFVARFVHSNAALQAPLLAGSLRRHAEMEDLTWEDLAISIGCSVEALDRIALCRPPRPDRFYEDVQAIADGLADPDRLLDVMRAIQVTTAFEAAATRPPAPPAREDGERVILMAARDREELADPAEDGAPGVHVPAKHAPGKENGDAGDA